MTTKLIVLGISQDGGYPQPHCTRPCCLNAERKLICSIAIFDGDQKYLIDCTPDFREQIKYLGDVSDTLGCKSKQILDGIFLTHAHMGHYWESMNTNEIPTHVMPEMKKFLICNAPFSQLVKLNNIRLIEMSDHVVLSKTFSITPILVPHRSEFTETVGFIIKGPNRKVLFIPDIDKFELMQDLQIEELIDSVDYAFLDGTFFDESEIKGRKISEIPHPLISESIRRFEKYQNKNRIYFTHLNHTNPCLKMDSKERLLVEEMGFHFLNDFDVFDL